MDLVLTFALLVLTATLAFALTTAGLLWLALWIWVQRMRRRATYRLPNPIETAHTQPIPGVRE